MSLPGKLIVIEGLEGAGKSTAIDIIANQLRQSQIKVQLVREPGGTAIGEVLRSILKNSQYKETLQARTELLLMYSARIQLLEEVIIPALKQNTWVIADRFELSSFAYQGGGRNLDREFIKQLSHFCLEGFTPDLTIYLDITPEDGMKRAKIRGQFDRIELETIDFFHRVYNEYAHLTQELSGLQRIDASLPLTQVQKELTKIIKQFIVQQTPHD